MNEQAPIDQALSPFIDSGALGGAATLVWRPGAPARVRCFGRRDLERDLPMERETLFRIASMTKPITSVAALMLLEEGRFELGEPITRWAPELAGMRVLHAADDPLDRTGPAARPITFDDLLTHRSGLSYADFHYGPIGAAYAAALGGHIDNDATPDEWIAALASLPLIDQPGAAFHYGHSTDLLGLLIARIEDAPLGDVLRHRIFEPLGMHDTGFTVDRAQHERRAQPLGFDGAGRLLTLPTVPGGHARPERTDDMPFVSGGQGLWSTLDDYLAFARLFVGAGRVDDVRLLQPETMALMTANRLTAEQRAKSTMLGLPLFADGHGFGLGVAVVMEPDRADPMRCGGGIGAVGWPGSYGCWWQADPNDGSVLLFFTHNMVELPQLARGIGSGAWRAIATFQALASRAVAA